MTDWIESEEFDGVCYSYRSWPMQDPAGVVARFEELKAYIKEHTSMAQEPAGWRYKTSNGPWNYSDQAPTSSNAFDIEPLYSLPWRVSALNPRAAWPFPEKRK